MKLGNDAQVRLNFSLEIKKLEQSVEVNIQADNISPGYERFIRVKTG